MVSRGGSSKERRSKLQRDGDVLIGALYLFRVGLVVAHKRPVADYQHELGDDGRCRFGLTRPAVSVALVRHPFRLVNGQLFVHR